MKLGSLAGISRVSIYLLKSAHATTNTNFALGIKDQVSQVNKTLDEAIQVKREADEAHLHEKILEWLTTIDFTDRQNRAYRARHRDTGEWFLGSTEFQNWIRAKGQTLFCPGKPGAGKTIMASIAIHHVRDLRLKSAL